MWARETRRRPLPASPWERSRIGADAVGAADSRWAGVLRRSDERRASELRQAGTLRRTDGLRSRGTSCGLYNSTVIPGSARV
jgi:hypothetical protein